MAERLRLTVACGDYEIVRAIKEGTVKADGLDLEAGKHDKTLRAFEAVAGVVEGVGAKQAPAAR